MANFSAARHSMVISQLQPSGVISSAVLAAFEGTSRELFVPEGARAAAYTDTAVDIGYGRVLPAPLMLAKMCQAAHLDKLYNVLCIGSGTGYAAAVLSCLAGSVVDYEPDARFDASARAAFAKIGLDNVTRVSGPPTSISRRDEGYDVIICDGAAAEVPYDLMPFLKRGGVMLALVVPGGQPVGQVVAVQKTASGVPSVATLFDSYAPYIPGFEPAARFVFA